MSWAVASIWRYPVKSMLGERLGRATLTSRGVSNDRLFAIRTGDGKFGSGKSTRRFRAMDGLFRFAARYEGSQLVIVMPGGQEVSGDDANLDAMVSEWLGQPVTIAREGSISHFDDAPIHVVTTSSLLRLGRLLGTPAPEERFRPNVVIATEGETFLEDGWLGQTLLIGSDVRLTITHQTERCVMTTFPQRDLPSDPSVLRTLADKHAACLGVYAQVAEVGSIAVGDPVRLLA